MDKVVSSKDFLMLLLYAKGHKKQFEPIRGRTRIMKMVFLFDKEVRKKFNLDKVIPNNVLPDFTPYDYGPFSSKVFDDLEFLVELGFSSYQFHPVADVPDILLYRNRSVYKKTLQKERWHTIYRHIF